MSKRQERLRGVRKATDASIEVEHGLAARVERAHAAALVDIAAAEHHSRDIERVHEAILRHLHPPISASRVHQCDMTLHRGHA